MVDNKLKVGIIGGSGYTGVELCRLLSTHPDCELTVITSRQYEGKAVSAVFPSLKERVLLNFSQPDLDKISPLADLFFTAVPHKTAMAIVPFLLDKGKKVVDLSADFRIRKPEVYERWYQPHSCPQLLSEAAYGLPELYRDKIVQSSLVANPGCYPTSVILALAPLLSRKMVDVKTVIADSKSGTTGAGRGLNTGSLFCEVSDSFKAYKVGGKHRHIPEIEQELASLAQTEMTISFTPHLLPINRGILSTVYADLTLDITEKELWQIYRESYDNEYFVRVADLGIVPATNEVRGTNYCDIGIMKDERNGRVIVVSVIDNIGKGASGQAIQNMNIMTGFAENSGLQGVSFFP